MYSNRKPLYKKLEEARNSKLLVYVIGDRRGLETQIAPDSINLITHHLDSFLDNEGNIPNKISLWLYSLGGVTLTGWCIANLLRHFCKELEVIVFSKAHSTATLICLGADNIIMTKQATLGPIDPSINSPLNPQMPGAPAQLRVPVSVENVAGYIELAKKECGLKDKDSLLQIFLKLSENVHPLALGEVFRARGQIQMLADRLLSRRRKPLGYIKKKKIISILCREAGSHDFTISRREARDLGLIVETPTMEFYGLLKQIHDDISGELELSSQYDGSTYLGTEQNKRYSFKRCIIESLSGSSHKYFTEGELKKLNLPTGVGINDQRTFEGWREDNN
ncbi:MAG: serine protease [Sedimentisphaerales bacterium]|jgi:hypothetical protein